MERKPLACHAGGEYERRITGGLQVLTGSVWRAERRIAVRRQNDGTRKQRMTREGPDLQRQQIDEEDSAVKGSDSLNIDALRGRMLECSRLEPASRTEGLKDQAD